MNMGMSNKQVAEMFILLLVVIIVYRISEYITNNYNPLFGLIMLVGSYIILIIYLSMRLGTRKKTRGVMNE